LIDLTVILEDFPFTLPCTGAFLVGAGSVFVRKSAPVLSLKLWPLSWLLSLLSSLGFLWSFVWAWGIGAGSDWVWQPLLMVLGWILLLAGLGLFLWALSAIGMRAIVPRPTDRLERRPPFHRIRRPMGLSFIAATLGATLIVNSIQAWTCFVLWGLLVSVLLELEEWELASRIPAAGEYFRSTPRYIPRRKRVDKRRNSTSRQ
jgi:protein-S-isoprenylcysteine O-methyltransferase Ste14